MFNIEDLALEKYTALPGGEKLEKCSDDIKAFALLAYATLIHKMKKQLIITSGYREGDLKQHGKGEAVDMSVPELHVHEYCGLIYDLCKKYSSDRQVTTFRIYEGIDPKDGKWKNHVHVDFGMPRNFIAVSTGEYKNA